MPISENLFKFVIGGTISTSQSWSTSFWLGGQSSSTVLQDPLNSLNEELSAKVAAVTGAFVGTCFGATTNLRRGTTYFWPAGASSSAMVSTTHAFTSNGSGDSLPSLLSVVLSTRTGTPGRSGRGRNYLPLTKAAALDATGQIGETLTGQLATNWAVLLGSFADVDNPSGQPCSPVVASFTDGLARGIESVVVNSMVDVQHRREDSVATATNATAQIT